MQKFVLLGTQYLQSCKAMCDRPLKQHSSRAVRQIPGMPCTVALQRYQVTLGKVTLGKVTLGKGVGR